MLNDINYEYLLKVNDKLTEYKNAYGNPNILESSLYLIYFRNQFILDLIYII